MWEILESIENSGFATYVRETPNVLGYSTVLALHTFGMAFLVGLSGMIALRILGFAPGLPLAPMEKFFPLIVIGFWVNAVTGLILVTLAARSLLTNWDFYVKLVAIGCALVSTRMLHANVFGDPANLDTRPVPMKGRILACTTLTFWVIAILAGRLTAYSGWIRRQTALAVLIAIVLLLAARHLFTRFRGSDKAAHQAQATASTNY